MKPSTEEGHVHMDIDEDLHSRQLAVYGRETMRKMATARVLVCGMNGLGAEVAKNVILAGVKSVTLQDTKEVSLWDLSAQFYLNEEDVGKNRAEACLARLRELNTAVSVRACNRNLDESLVADHSVVVLTDTTMEMAKRIDAFCHQQTPAIAFIHAKSAGVFSSVFCDFGPSFTVHDVDGENPHTGIVASISNGYPALVTCIEDERLEFQDGELVTFSEVKGMTEINNLGPISLSK
eukprot:jgi/Pico_ML_1/54986/g113.t1